MCVFSFNPLVLDSHPSINCVPFVKTTLAMECPKSHDPFVFQFSQLLTFRTFAIPLLMASPLQLLTSGVQIINKTNSYVILITVVIVGAAIPEMFI